MFSIWGKVLASSTPLPLTGKESKQQRETEENYYYTSSSGQILSADGSAYAIPALFSKSFDTSSVTLTPADRAESKNVHPSKENEDLRSPALSTEDNAVIEEKRSAVLESENFIPLSYAKLKLKQLSEELAICKDNYQAKLQALNSQHTQKMNQSKNFYEELIKEMKSKALQHVELQKRMRRESEEKLEKELKRSEEMLEELRDNTATLNMEHQERVRMLKQSLLETDQQRSAHFTALQDLMASTSCSMALAEIVGQIESKAFSDETYATFQTELRNLTQQHREQLRRKESEFSALLAEEKRSTSNFVHNSITAKYAERDYNRSVCQETLTYILDQLEIQNDSSLRATEKEKEESRTAYITRNNQQFQELLKEKENSILQLENSFQEQMHELKELHSRELNDLQGRLDRSEVVLCLEAVIVDLTCLATTDMCDKKLQWMANKHEKQLNYLTQSQQGEIMNLSDVQVRSEVSLTLANAVSNVVDTLTTSELEKNRIQRERDQSSQNQLISQLNKLRRELLHLDETEQQVKEAQEELQIKAAEVEASRLREEHLLFLSADLESKTRIQQERFITQSAEWEGKSLSDSRSLTQLQQQISEEQLLKAHVLQELEELKSREIVTGQIVERSPRLVKVDCDAQTSARGEEGHLHESAPLKQEQQQGVHFHQNDMQVNELQEKLDHLNELLQLESSSKADILSAGSRKENELLEQIDTLTEQCRTLSADCEQRKLDLINMATDLAEKSRQLDEKANGLNASITGKEGALNVLVAEKQLKIDELNALLLAAQSKSKNSPVLVDAESQFDLEVEETFENLTEDKEDPSTREKELQEELRLLQESLALLTSECDALVDTLTALADQVSEVTANNAASAAEKEALKQFIKDWTKSFSETNGREPDVKDKAAIKDRYKAYKDVTNKSKELETKQDALTQEKAKVDEQMHSAMESKQRVEGRIAELLAALQEAEKERKSARERKPKIPRNNTDKILHISKTKPSVSDEAVQTLTYRSPRDEAKMTNEAQNHNILDLAAVKPSLDHGATQTLTFRSAPEKVPGADNTTQDNFYLEELQNISNLLVQEKDIRVALQNELKVLSEESEKKVKLAFTEANQGIVSEYTQKIQVLEDQVKGMEEQRAVDSTTIDNLDDQILNIKAENQKTKTDLATLQNEKGFMQTQLDSLIKEKRTDVVKRFEDEIDSLRLQKSELELEMDQMRTEKKKADSKIAELKGRAELAEQELRDRDAREQEKAKLSNETEKFALQGQLSKQRDQIILKSKAATAGWDAAAQSDEKVDVEAKKAYRRGQMEEREMHKSDMDAINKALEKKEERITELLLQVTEMQAAVASSRATEQAMKAQMDQMAADVADTIATIGASATGSASGVSTKELDEARDALDLAQDELVSLTEQKESLEIALQAQKKICEMFQQLALNSGLISTSVTTLPGSSEESDNNSLKASDSEVMVLKYTGASISNGAGNLGRAAGGRKDGLVELADVLASIKRSIVKGTNLWKSNRRDECYDLYLETCEEANRNLRSNELRNPLTDAINNGRTQGALNKQRGAVIFRKALDKVLVESQLPNIKKAEDDLVQELRDKSVNEKEAAHEKEAATGRELQLLVEDLNELLQEEKRQQQQLEREKQREIEQQQELQRQQLEGKAVIPPPDASASASSLLGRARAAEELVRSLRRQLDTVVSAAAAANNGDPVHVVAGNDNIAVAATAVNGTASASQISDPMTASGAAGPLTLTSRPAPVAAQGGGADPSEVRKLNRRIKELEAQLKTAASSGGGSGANNLAPAGANANAGGGDGGSSGGSSSEAKLLQRKLKDLETSSKKESKQLEARASKAEAALQKLQSSQQSIVTERDALKQENVQLSHLKADLDSFRAKADRCKELEAEVAKRDADLTQMAELFKKETALRKKYKNDLEDLKGAIRVYARCRPMARYEIEKGCKTVVEIKDETSLKVTTNRGEKEFEFDSVFSATSTQDAVFEDTKRLVESCLDGFNVCVFAFGQTGSGKTFTMTGSPSMPGLTPKAIDELFRLIAEKPQLTCKVTTYFLELYNDNLVDLFYILDNKKNKTPGEPPRLDIKMDNNKMVFIRNSVIKEAFSPEELMDLFTKGNLERHTGATMMNAESSRSHSIFAIMVEAYDSTSKRTTVGKLSIVDLAGSERADKTGASAERLREAQSINKSLSALGDVISALSVGEKFIPYRNNKLTQVMQDSLGGNAKTLMFVNFSPADYNADETATSLSYAARVKKIVNNASKQAESEEVARLKALVKRLQAANAAGHALAPEELGLVAEAEAPPPIIEEDDGKVATVQEREEQMRAQIAALSCEVSLSAIDTVVKLLVLRAKKRPKTRYEYNAERVRDFKVGKDQDEERMGKGFMIPPMKSNTGTSAYLSALVEQPQELSQTAILSQTDVDNKQREIISEESNKALLRLYTKSRVRDMYMEKHTSKVQMPLATWSSLSQPHSSRRKANPATNDKRRRLLDVDGEVYDDEEGNAEEMEDREGSELLQELDQSVVTAQQHTVAAASLPSSSAPAHSLTASHSTPQITADGPAFRYDKQKSKYEYNQERKRDFRYSREKSKQRAKLEEAQSTDKKLTGKTSYADLEEEWGAQTLISLYIRDYDKKVFDNCIKLGSNRFHAADFQHLQKLDLSHQLIGDEQLKRLWAITPTMLQGLENLNLAGNNITDAGMKDFSKVQRSLRSLVQLNLSCNDFGDVGISLLLLEDTYSASLRVLDISFNSLGVLAAYRLATQMFERDRRAHLEVLFMGGKVRGRTLGDTFIQVFLHAMIQENSRIGLKRLKVLHIPDCNLTTTTIDALSLYLSCDEVALRQLSICQNTINFLPYTPLPRKKCETKAAFFSAILQNSSLHWLLSRQCNLTSSELGIIETSLTRNMRNSRLSHDKRKAKPSLHWADRQQLALRSSIAANVCETNFYEVIMEETNIWNQKKPTLIKLVPFEITHDIVAEMEHTLSRTTIYSGSGDPDLALNPPLGDVLTAAMRYANIVLSALEQVREAHVILRTKEDTPHTALLSHRETHNRKGRAEREREEEAQRKELKSFQKQVIDELQRASQQFRAAEREISFTEERHLAAMNNLQDGLLTYRTAASHLRSEKQREEELTTILKRILRNREMDHRKIAQIQRFASASHDASDNGMYLSTGRVNSPLYSPDRAGAAMWSSGSPPSSPSQMLSPTRGPLDEEELQSRIRAGEEQELDVGAMLAEVEAELSICHAETSCCYESLLMGVEDLSAAALEEIFLMQRLVGCFHKTNIINDFWKAAFAEKREDISWALHPYLHKMCPNHRTLDLAAFFAHYWHFHFFRDKEIAKMKQQPQPAEMSPPPTASAADAESMEVIIQWRNLFRLP